MEYSVPFNNVLEALNLLFIIFYAYVVETQRLAPLHNTEFWL